MVSTRRPRPGSFKREALLSGMVGTCTCGGAATVAPRADVESGGGGTSRNMDDRLYFEDDGTIPVVGGGAGTSTKPSVAAFFDVESACKDRFASAEPGGAVVTVGVVVFFVMSLVIDEGFAYDTDAESSARSSAVTGLMTLRGCESNFLPPRMSFTGAGGSLEINGNFPPFALFLGTDAATVVVLGTLAGRTTVFVSFCVFLRFFSEANNHDGSLGAKRLFEPAATTTVSSSSLSLSPPSSSSLPSPTRSYPPPSTNASAVSMAASAPSSSSFPRSITGAGAEIRNGVNVGFMFGVFVSGDDVADISGNVALSLSRRPVDNPSLPSYANKDSTCVLIEFTKVDSPSASRSTSVMSLRNKNTTSTHAVASCSFFANDAGGHESKDSKIFKGCCLVNEPCKKYWRFFAKSQNKYK
mmetsp:Transcript_941/g.2026  ORF Transcript_941/g.2026 Transcript_941/m.2026 type:complete len:413 (-) Transcript_941:1879-3117(-)